MKIVQLLAACILISACGSGESTLSDSAGVTFNGNQQAASINDENAKQIGTAAGESIQRAAWIGALTLPINTASTANISASEINQSASDSSDQANDVTAAATLATCTSGSATISQSTLSSGAISHIVVYNRCKLIGSNTTANGRVTVIYNNIENLSAGFNLTYTNLTLSTTGSADIRLNVKVICANLTSCTYNSDFIGSDGRTHRVTSFNLTGNATSGFNGSATFYHGQHGRVSIASSGLTYGNCGTEPDGGVISFSSNNGSSGTIIFDPDCTVSGTWSNNSGAGAF